MSKEALMRKIQALSFAKTEAELYLDCYPDNTAALDYYKKLMAELESATLEYEDKYGPIKAGGGSLSGWDWIKGPWPWYPDFETEGK